MCSETIGRPQDKPPSPTPKMASCEIQVVNPALLAKIENYMADASYREAIENSANYNTRLCIERRLRMPFLDSQTGVAQNHSNLFMSARERIPGLLYGQVYTYPSKRWRKKRRQYLMQPQVSLRRSELPSENIDLHTISTVENPAAVMNEDSKDSTSIKDDLSAKTSQDAWYYDELELQAMEGFDDVDPDSDYDYEETYSKRRKKRGGGKTPGGRSSITPTDSPHPKKGGKVQNEAYSMEVKHGGIAIGRYTHGTGVGRGRKKGVNYAELGDSEKPFSCDLCGARYKTRPGLTYHYTHSHKDGATGSSGSGRSGGGGPPMTPPSGPQPLGPPDDDRDPGHELPPPGPGSPLLPQQSWPPYPQPVQDSYLNYLNTPGVSRRGGRHAGPPPPHSHMTPPPGMMPLSSMDDKSQPGPAVPPPKDRPPLPMPGPSPEQVLVMEQNEKERAAPSPYCDFCLGDAVSNKKSGQPEELVSCSDCGRSGHPSCLLFTDNMIVSVRKYRWQCIECKCCSLCGTSDNDDQLLFCDDCDRGYHMYCLIPPLDTPPEGSWSCRTCIRDFHGGVVPNK